MKRFAVLLLFVLLPSLALADRIIEKGSTNQWGHIRIIDAADGTPETGVDPNTAGLDLEYARLGAGVVDITEADNTDPNTHSDGGLFHSGHGNYWVGLPDAAVAWGADHVVLQGTATDMIVIGETIQLSGFDLQESQAARRIGRTIYVDNQTEGFGSDGSFEAPYNTIAAAVAVVQSGDTIYLYGGSTYAELVDLSSTENVTICGESRGAVLLQTAVATQGNGLITCGDGTTVRDLSISVSSGNGAAIAFSGARNIVIERVTASGRDDGVYADFLFSNYNNLIVRDSLIYSRFDGVRLKGGCGTLIENCDIQLFTLTDPNDPPAISGVNMTANAAADSSPTCTVRNCRFFIKAGAEHASDSYPKYGVRIDGSEACFMHVEGCYIDIEATDPNDHGTLSAANVGADAGEKSLLLLRDCQVALNHSGDGTVEVASASDDGVVELVNCSYTDALGTGAFDRTPQATYATNGGLPTVDGSNYIAGLQGTLNTLDALDTAQDSQHATTQSDTAAIVADTNELQADWANGGRLDTVLDTAADPNTTWNHNISTLTDPNTAGGILTARLDAAVSSVTATTQPRVNKPAGPSYRLRISSNADGTYKATRKVRLRPGAVDLAVSVDMAPQFGSEFVETVGTPTVSGGSITAAALGPRDTAAMVQLSGTASASETQDVEFLVTMDNGDAVLVTFDVEVFAD